MTTSPNGGNLEGADPGEQTQARFVFSTDVLPARDRFAFMREEIVTRHLNYDVVNHSGPGYRGVIEASMAGDVAVAYLYGSPAKWERTKKALADADDGVVLYLLNRKSTGSMRMEQRDVDVVTGAGTGFLFHAGQTGSATVLTSGDAWSVKVPATALARVMPPNQSPRPLSIEAHDPLMILLLGHVEMFSTLPPDTDPGLRARIGVHLADLVAYALGAQGEALEQIQDRGLKAARTQAVLKAIGSHAAHADFSAQDVGRVLGLSVRQVHRLLEETPKTFYEHVLEARLLCAWQMLADPRFGAAKIAEIAEQAGFVNVTHFNRLFRTRFGDTPSGARASANTTRGLRVLRQSAGHGQDDGKKSR